MKKRIIYSSLLTALFSASTAFAGGPEVMPVVNFFDGFYIAGFGGAHNNSFDGNSNIFLSEPVVVQREDHRHRHHDPVVLFDSGTLDSGSFSGGGYDGYGGVKGGFGKTWNMLYVGAVGGGEWGQTTITSGQTLVVPFNHDLTIGDTHINTSASATTTTTMKISNDAFGAAKIGIVPSPKALLYGVIGASFARVSVTNSLNTQTSFHADREDRRRPFSFDSFTNLNASSSSNNNWKEGLLLGAGAEYMVIPNVSIGAEYDYTNYGGVNTGPARLTGTETNSRHEGEPRDITTNVFTSGSVTGVHVSSITGSLSFYFSDYMAKL
jgi:opacity protein-like surface antigen